MLRVFKTTLDLLNVSGVSESHAASAVSLALSDTTYHFECVQNGQDGNNVQGTTYNTGISPDNNWHRFRMRSIVQGQILFSIDGGTEQSLSMSTDTIPGYSNASSTASVEVFGNYATVVGNINILPVGQVYYGNPCWGTPATLSGCTGGAAIFNGTWPIGDNSTILGDSQILLNSTVNSSASQTSSSITFSWYNAFYPLIQFGSDSESAGSVKAFDVDFFGFAYNPGLATDFTQTADPTKSRFFAAQT